MACQKSDTDDLDGSTYCVSDISECPVTDLLILEVGDPILEDSRYESKQAATDSNLFLAFSRETFPGSAAPL